jgi:predicted nucleotidyltransferase
MPLIRWTLGSIARYTYDMSRTILSNSVPINDADLAAFCQTHGVARLSLFGSVLRNDFDASRSDVDVLVEFLPGARKNLFKLIEMQNTLAEMFGRNVDLNTPGSLSKYFRDDVLASAQVLYDAA